MIEQLKEISDALASMLQVLGVLVPTYLVALGLARRAGKQAAFKKKQEAWGGEDPFSLKLILEEPQNTPPWKDPAVLSGGFLGLVTVLFWASFVLVGLLVPIWFPSLPTSSQPISDRLAQLVYLPNLLIGANMAVRSLIVRGENSLLLAFGAITCAMLATGILFFVALSTHQIVLQLIIFFVLSIVMSYRGGVAEGGFFSLRPAFVRYPVVEVVLTNGERLGLMRLYQTTATDYRFIRDDEVELILPSQQIAEIRYFPPSYLEENHKPENG